MHSLAREQLICRPLEQTFPFFADPGNLDAITPAWLHFRIVTAPAYLSNGSEIVYRLRWRGLPVHWTAKINGWDPPHSFVDTQIHAVPIYSGAIHIAFRHQALAQ